MPEYDMKEVRAAPPQRRKSMNERSVVDGPYNKLLGDLLRREMILRRHESSHPVTIARVIAALDANGPSEAGDVIHGLLYAMVNAEHRAAVMADLLGECEERLFIELWGKDKSEAISGQE